MPQTQNIPMLDEDILQQAIEKATPTEKLRLLAIVQELDQRRKKEKARVSFMTFVEHMWPEFIHGSHHRRMAEAFERVARGQTKRLAICMPPRHAIMTSMNIPTTSGFKTMADLQVGDFVFNPNGLPIAVLGKSEVFKNREIYRVTTDDGFSLDVDGEHLWTVRLDRKHSIFKTYTTEQLYQRQCGALLRTTTAGNVEIRLNANIKNPRLPMLPSFAAIETPHLELPVDPYVLGLWLGDGSKNNGVITSHDDDAVFVRAELERRGYTTTDQSTKYTFGVLGLKVKLRELGVLNDKHIPNMYMFASATQRRDLLKGLMDSDGNISKKGQCFFAQRDKRLVDQVRELLASLGIKNSILVSEAKIKGKSYGMHYKISFYATDIARLERKEARTLKNERAFGRYISIEKLNKTADTQCIQVDSDDGLFLAGEGFIVTHNTKSEFASFLLPAWFLGLFPSKQIMQLSHTADLAEQFGRKVRNLVDSDVYHEVFPDTRLRKDSTAAARWNTDKNGIYQAMGVGAAVAGKGADLLIIDDPISEQEGKGLDPKPFDSVYDYYMTGPRQRLQPGGSIILVMTRWNKRDLVGRLMDNAIKNPEGDQWELIEFPAILPSGNPLWPEFWKLEDLLRTKTAIDNRFWQAQYQQNPTSEEGAIVKREWWQRWEHKNPPPFEYVIMAWDTAFESHNRADYSAMTVWGVFYREDDQGVQRPNIIVLDAVKKRVEFPELKAWVLEAYEEWAPDSMIVEKRASGASLIQELRRMGIPVMETTPGKGNDKISRLNAVADIFASGFVWAPETRWADELIDDIASFPAGSHDDLVDSTVYAVTRLRQGGFIRTALDEEDDETIYYRRKKAYY